MEEPLKGIWSAIIHQVRHLSYCCALEGSIPHFPELWQRCLGDVSLSLLTDIVHKLVSKFRLAWRGMAPREGLECWIRIWIVAENL